MFTPFYHQLLRKYHVAFGSLFKAITLVRNDVSGAESQRFVVPIEYAQRESWLTRLRSDPVIAQDVSNVVPRLAFEMTGLRYDNARKLNGLLPRFRPSSTGDPASMQRFFSGVPYILTFSLYALTRNVEDANEIVEQIIPYFSPDYSLLVKVLPSLGMMDRMRILMDGTPQWSDTYEQDGFTKTRDLVVTFNFSAYATFYGPIPSAPSAIIRKVIIDLYKMPYDATLTPSTYLLSPHADRVLLEDGTGRLLDETSVTDARDLAHLERMVIEPDPLNAQPVKPVDYTTTITTY